MALRREINAVLTIPSWYPEKDHAISQGLFLFEQALCLAKRFDVSVITPRFPSLLNLCAGRLGPKLIEEQQGSVTTLRVRYVKIPTLRRWIPFLAGANDVLAYYRKFAAAIRDGFTHHVSQRGLPDLIHAHVVLPAGWVAVELGRRHGIPVVLTEHSGPFGMHLRTEEQRNLVRDILGRADRLVAVSPALKKTMADFYSDANITVVGNLVDTEFFTPAVRDTAANRPFRFFFLGALVEIKGVCHLLNAVHELVAQGFRNFDLYLGGDGPLGPKLKEMAAKLGIADRCHFLGLLSREEVRKQMRACDVFVLPSLCETFGIVNGEAMACGKPVLSTRCGGPEYVVTPEAGLLVTPGSSHELADAMAMFLRRRVSFDPTRIRASVVRRFGSDAFLARTQDVYRSVAREFRASAA